MIQNVGGTGFILCVGVPLQEVAQVARLLRDRAVVLAAGDLGAARALLAPVGGERQESASRNVDAHAPPPAAAPAPAADLPTATPAHVRLRAGRLAVDLAAREVTIDGRSVHLSAREFDLLALLASDTGRVWTFADLTAQIWDSDFLGDKDQLVSTVKRLRRRLATHRGYEVRSVHGVGYRLRVPRPDPVSVEPEKESSQRL